MSRPAEAFLDAAGWSKAVRTPIAGDASSRRYVRVKLGSNNAILMEDPDGSIPNFLHVAAYLKQASLRPPDIIFTQPNAPFLLIEDFGSVSFAQRLEHHAPEALGVAVDVLDRLQAEPPMDGRTVLTPEVATDLTKEGLGWLGLSDELIEAVCGELKAALTDLGGTPNVTSLRDYHVENLMWQAAATGTARAGLLDFQDAVTAPPIYDLVSLCDDVRRDIDPTVTNALKLRMARCLGQSQDAITAAYAVWSIQRNLRIAGVFSRLARQDGKPSYLTFMPRVWSLLQRAAAHPELRPLASVVSRIRQEVS